MSSVNPLFPGNDEPAEQTDGYLLSPKQNAVTPPAQTEQASADNPAADLIREKLQKIYSEEPSAKEEITEAATVKPRSKHQEFMYALSRSGKSLAEIQTEWHNYYISLPDHEKHQVWQEFYESNANSAYFAKQKDKQPPQVAPETTTVVVSEPEPVPPAKAQPTKAPDTRTPQAIKAALRDRVSARGKLTAKHHFQSLLFGLGMGALVIFIFLFGFFNEVIIAPFIQPGRNASATPIILDPNGVTPTATPEVIIPKINVEIPVDYTQTSTDENVIENALQNGVVHYPNTVMPGQTGNAAFFGHSSNNIFNKGKYKFAFVLLHTLVPGDTFYLTYNDKVYVYKVTTKTIVDPSDVGVLGPVAGQTATATLITCDPPGTSLHRLVIVGQQVSPDPSTNAQSNQPAATAPTQLASNGPTLWSRLMGTIYGKVLVVATLLLLIFIGRRTWRQWRTA